MCIDSGVCDMKSNMRFGSCRKVTGSGLSAWMTLRGEITPGQLTSVALLVQPALTMAGLAFGDLASGWGRAVASGQRIEQLHHAGDDTAGRVRRLCAKARAPLRPDLVEALGIGDLGLTTGAICVYPTMVPHAVAALEGSGIPVASVATGFPAGLMPLPLRLAEIRYAVEEGAAEIDIVITREYALTGQWSRLHDEIAAMREACGAAHLKAILATGELGTLTNVYAASMVAMQAGADFIKTSTGKETVNATLPVALTMIRAIRDYQDRTGTLIGYKPAGGLRSAKAVMKAGGVAVEDDEVGTATRQALGQVLAHATGGPADDRRAAGDDKIGALHREVSATASTVRASTGVVSSSRLLS